MDDKKEGVPNYPPPEYIAKAAGHGIHLRQSAPLRRPPQPMQLPILDYMRSKRVILASASPRRRALLGQLGLPNLDVIPSDKPENLDKTELGPDAYVAATARQKCLDVYQAALAVQERQHEADAAAAARGAPDAPPPPGPGPGRDRTGEDPALVIAADTVIVLRNGTVVEKPRSEADHARMLRALRDQHFHRVLTAVCVLAPKADASHPGYALAADAQETRVFFVAKHAGLPDDVIDAYVATREGADKAGGYAIQGMAGSLLVDRVEGSVDNVVGLPVRMTLQLCEQAVKNATDGARESEGEEEEEE